MPTRNVNLTDHYDQFVEGLIGSGRYTNASEVMRAGLRLLEREAKEDEEKLAALRTLAAEGFDALDRGEGTTLEGEREVADFILHQGDRRASGPANRPPSRRPMTDAPLPDLTPGRAGHRGDPRVDA